MKNPLGGFAKKSFFVRELEKKGHSVLLLDGGNLLFSRPVLKEAERGQFTLKAGKIVEACNASGLDAACVGPLDFAEGLDALLRIHRNGKHDLVCANLVWERSGTPVLKPYTVIEKEGLSIGVFGLLDPASPLQGLGSGSQGARVRVEPLFETAAKAAAQLRKRGCRVVVALSAVDPKRIRVLAKRVPEVDIFIGGDPTDKLMIPYRVGSTLVAGSSQLGKYVGHVEVSAEARGRVALKHAFVPMRLDRREDPPVKRIVDEYYRTVAKFRTERSGMYVKETEEAVNLARNNPVYASAALCKSCHRAQYDRWKASRHARALSSLPAQARSQVECLECHVTGLGEWGGYGQSGGLDLGGVQCEECHGPGSLHPANPGIRDGEAAKGACRRCHTRARSPEFSQKEYLRRLGCGP